MDKTETLTAGNPAPVAPIQTQRQPSDWWAEFSHNQIIEYHCGNCHKAIYYACWRATYCPHCGAPIFNFPRKKLDSPHPAPGRGWNYADQERLKYAGPGRTTGSKSERQAAPGQRSGQAAHHKRKRRAVP